MLPEGEDLLQQLSGELGIPEFLEDLPMLEESNLADGPDLYNTLMTDAILDGFDTPSEPNFTLEIGRAHV